MIPIPQSTARRVDLLVFDTGTAAGATGKTVAVTISKNGGAFGNPSAGATNATEVSNGLYYVDLSTTDTNTLGDLLVRGVATGCDVAFRLFGVVNANHGGMLALPNAAAEAAGGLFTRGTGAGQVNQAANGQQDVNVVGWLGTAPATPTVNGVPEVDITHSNGVALTNSDFTLAAVGASNATVTLPTTFTGGGSLPNDGAYAYFAFRVVAGAGAGQVFRTTTATGTARQYNVLAGSAPTTLDNTSQCVILGSWNANATHWASAAAADVYHADVNFTRDQANTQDEYTVTWFKNGVRVASGITSPTIQVVKRADGTDLVASTAMTQIGSTGSYKYDATTTARLTVGEAALVLVGATIDGSARSFSRNVSRDSA